MAPAQASDSGEVASARSRLKPWQRTVLIFILVVLVLGAAGYLLYDIAVVRPLRRELAWIEARGESLRLEDLAPDPVPADENAAPLYERAFALLQASGSDTENVLVEALNAVQDEAETWDEALRDALAYASEEGAVNPDGLTEEDARQAVERRLARNRAAMELIRQANEEPLCRFDVDYGQIPVSGEADHESLVESMRLFALESRTLRRKGDGDGAAEAGHQVILLEKATREPAWMSSCMTGSLFVAVATDTCWRPLIDAPQVTFATWRRCLDALNAIDRRPVFLAALQGERAMMMGYIDKYAGNPKALGALTQGRYSPPPPPPPSAWQRVWHPRLTMDRALYLWHMREMIEIGERPPWKALTGAVDAQNTRRSDPKWAIATRALAPSYRFITVCVEDETRLALARVALALKLHKHAHGAYPAALDVFAPDVLKEVPIDPCRGKPFVYRREGDGFLLYSFGLDQADDDGNEVPPDPSKENQGVDLVWRAQR